MNSKYNAQSFILASASPRRRLLLGQAGYTFDVIPSHVDESNYPTQRMQAVEYACHLALTKARDVAWKHTDRLVLGADTVVDFEGELIGKPQDAADAERIIRLLFSAPHKVITGIALVRIADSTEIVDAETTVVYPRRLTEQQIAKHIVLEDWKGKAGAYGIQEAGDQFVERIEGSFTNVIGLPMELTQRLLQELNITPNP
jgi:septum formation protein